MNKKVASEIAVGVLLLIAIAVGGIFWMQNKKQEVVNNQKQLVVPAPVAQQKQQQAKPAVESASLQTYANAKYGFELKIPADWKNYSVEDISRAGQIGTQLAFQLPTKDPEWLKIGQQKGTAFALLVVSDVDIKNINSECKKVNSSVFCLSDNEKVGKNNNYTFYFHAGTTDKTEYPNDFPSDFFNQRDEIGKSITFTN